MAGTEGDIIQVTLAGLLQAQQYLNVHYYRIEDVPTEGYLEGITDEFEAEILPKYADVQSINLDYISITAKNIFNFDEYVRSPVTPDQGTLSSGADEPSFVSANIKLVRSNARVRHGRKMVGGGMEASANGQVWESTYVTTLQNLADALAGEIVAGGVDFFKPVIVGRVKYNPDPEEPEHFAYRLPESQVEMGDKWAYVISAQASQFITSMNTRKLGRGS